MQRNVADWERVASVVTGTFLLATALKKKRVDAGTIAALVLMIRGLSGRCPVYSAAGLNSRRSGFPRGIPHRRLITGTVSINRPATEVVDAWRTVQSVPESLSSLELLQDDGQRQPSAAISFRELTRGGCEVIVSIAYDDSTGPAIAALQKLRGQSPTAQLHEDLRKFKQLVETGEVPIGAKPSGRRTLKFRALRAVTA